MSKAQKRITKYKREGLDAAEIERRLAQSAQSKAVQTQNLRQQVRKRAAKLVVREGDTVAANQKYDLIAKKGRSQTMQMNEYLRSIAHPQKYTALIPDPSTFPRGLAQLRSVITASTWKSESSPAGDDEIFFVAFPGLNNCYDGYHGRFEMDGVEYTDSAFDVHDYTNWNSLLQSFRPVSMCVDVTYIGPALDNKGQVAIACFPPYQTVASRSTDSEVEKEVKSFVKDCKAKQKEKVTDDKPGSSKRKNKTVRVSDRDKHVTIGCENPKDSLTNFGANPSLNFETVAEYNYAYTGAARGGAYQIWMPDGARCFLSYQPDSVMSSLPYIVFAAKGLSLPEDGSGAGWLTTEPIFRIEVTLNIETYSVVQLLTANQQAGKPDALKMSQALQVVAQSHVNGNANARGGGGDSVYSQILNVAKNAMGFVWDNRALIPPILEGAASLLA